MTKSEKAFAIASKKLGIFFNTIRIHEEETKKLFDNHFVNENNFIMVPITITYEVPDE